MNKDNRLAFIDSLRGFAALYVLIYHMYELPQFKPSLPYFLEKLVGNGGTGVTLFFVISAFTLCYTLKGGEANSESVKKFYVRRIFRIMPLYYLWLFLMYTWKDQFKGWLATFPYLFFLFSFVPGKQEGVVPASWTLGVEMIFYLAFPFILQLVQNLRSAVIFFIAALIIAVTHFYLTAQVALYRPNFSLFHQLPVFAAGIILYYLYQNFLPAIKEKKLGIIIFLTGAAGFVLMPFIKIYFGFTHIYIIALFYCCIFLGLAVLPVKLIVNKVSVFCGLISYSVYLNHPLIVNYLSDKYIRVYDYVGNNTLGLLACYFITLLPLILLSYITYRLVEKPFMRMGKFLLKKYYPSPNTILFR